MVWHRILFPCSRQSRSDRQLRPNNPSRQPTFGKVFDEILVKRSSNENKHFVFPLLLNSSLTKSCSTVPRSAMFNNCRRCCWSSNRFAIVNRSETLSKCIQTLSHVCCFSFVARKKKKNQTSCWFQPLVGTFVFLSVRKKNTYSVGWFLKKAAR